MTSSGVSAPFFSGCHSSANSGYNVPKVFTPGAACRLLQTGQSYPMVLDFTRACHSCPFGHRHQTLRLLPPETSSGCTGRFFSGIHCASSCSLPVRRQYSRNVSCIFSPPFLRRVCLAKDSARRRSCSRIHCTCRPLRKRAKKHEPVKKSESVP